MPSPSRSDSREQNSRDSDTSRSLPLTSEKNSELLVGSLCCSKDEFVCEKSALSGLRPLRPSAVLRGLSLMEELPFLFPGPKVEKLPMSVRDPAAESSPEDPSSSPVAAFSSWPSSD